MNLYPPSPFSSSTVLLLLVVGAGLALGIGCGEDVEQPQQEDGGYDVIATVDGIEAGELVVSNGGEDSVTITENGVHRLWEELDDGTNYDVIIEQEPEDHDCEVISASAVIDGADVEDVEIGCTHLYKDDVVVAIDADASLLEGVAGDTIVVAADVTNTGTLTDEREVTLSLDGEQVGHRELQLHGESSRAVAFSWETEQSDAGSYEAVVSTGDDDDEATIVLDEYVPDYFELSIGIETSSSTTHVEAGEEIEVVATVENVGNVSGSDDVEFVVGGQVVDEVTVEDLEPGDTESVPLHWATQDDDVGSFGGIIATETGEAAVALIVADPQDEASVGGQIVDDDSSEPLAGVEVLLFEQGDSDPLDSVTAGQAGDYLFDDLQPGDYELSLQSPGLPPGFTIDDAATADGDDTRLGVQIDTGLKSRDISVGGAGVPELIIDGGQMDFQPDDDGSPLSVDLPGCQQDGAGDWEPVDTDPGSDNLDISYDPSDQCFRIENINVDLATGELEVGVDDIVFPDVEVEVDDEDDNLDDNLDTIEVEFQWLFDDIGGYVDFVEGSLQLDLDMRILVGGTGYSGPASLDFGARDGYDDCQFTGGWGGDVENPLEDEDTGEYIHDPVTLRLTTGESGPDDASGEPFDVDERRFVTVDNAFEVGRLSEGEIGADDPGGASCGELNIFDFQEDFAVTFNDFGDLPAEEGEVYGEFEFVLP